MTKLPLPINEKISVLTKYRKLVNYWKQKLVFMGPQPIFYQKII